MNKKLDNRVHLITYDAFGNEFTNDFILFDKACERFVQFVSLHLSIGFGNVRCVRVVSGNHVMFEFRDVRALRNQNSLKF